MQAFTDKFLCEKQGIFDTSIHHPAQNTTFRNISLFAITIIKKQLGKKPTYFKELILIFKRQHIFLSLFLQLLYTLIHNCAIPSQPTNRQSSC